MRRHEKQRQIERSRCANDIAHHNRRHDARRIAEHVEHPARQARQTLGRHVRHHRPAERGHALAEKGQRHHRDHGRLIIQPDAAEDAGGQHHAQHQRHFARPVQTAAAFKDAIRDHAPDQSPAKAADRGQSGGKPGLRDREAAFFDQIDRKPCDEEIGQHIDAVLPDIDAQHHAIGQQGPDIGPVEGQRLPAAALQRDLPAALADQVQLGGIDARMPVRPVDHFRKDQRGDHPHHAHHPEHRAPAMRMHHPAHDRRKGHQREILRAVENGRGRATLGAGKPCRHQSRIAGKRRRLGQTDQKAQREKRGDRRNARHNAHQRLRGGQHRPDGDGDGVNPLGSETIQQRAARNLRQRIGPCKGRKHVSCCHRCQR